MLHIPTNKSKNIIAIFFCIAKNAAKNRDAQGLEPEKFIHCLTLCILMDSSPSLIQSTWDDPLYISRGVQ